jgi:hypothetical protein
MTETCSFITEYIWIISACGWLFNNKSITMHGNMNVKDLRTFCFMSMSNMISTLIYESVLRKYKKRLPY